MSVISDPDFLIHSIRLQYLRNVEDPYGPRLISLDPSYRSNPYIAHAGLADVERWPELALPSSPTPSDDEGGPSRRGGRPSGFPGATGLKYTTTILGPSRTGALGLRVSGKRQSLSNAQRNSMRRSMSQPRPANEDTDPPTDVDVTPRLPSSASPRKADLQRKTDIEITVQDASSDSKAPAPAAGPSADDASVAQAAGQPAAPMLIPFIPKFKGAAEMEARRQQRMRNRFPPRGAQAQPQLSAPANLNPEISSSSSSSSSSSASIDDDGPDVMPDDDDDFDDDIEDEQDIEDDMFDPEFAGSRGTMLDDASDGSLMSGEQSINSDYSMMQSSLPPNNSTRNRLSPVRESHTNEEKSTNVTPERMVTSEKYIDSYFEMVTVAPSDQRQFEADKPAGGKGLEVPGPPSSSSVPSASPSASMFARQPVEPVRPVKSALSVMLANEDEDTTENPFSELYSAISGRAEADSMNVQVFFPHAKKPAGEAMQLHVRKDATIEEVLGFALWTYWEEGWQPRIDEGLSGEDDSKWATTCSALGWILRIAEDDGEVDEDFPPPDRTGKISKFNFEAYAVLEASPAQIQQNKLMEAKIQRRLSRIVLKKKKSTELLKHAGPPSGSGLAPPSDISMLATSAGLTGSMLGTSLGLFPSSLGPSSSHGPLQFLRIRIADMADAGHVSTTIPASGGQYMAEVLEAVCAKRQISNSKDYALVLDLKNEKLFIPLDRTVRSLQGNRDLMLIRKSMIQNYGVDMGKRNMTRSTDPNASIVKRASEVPEQTLSSAFDYTSAYKRYTVYRKVPMLVTRSARLLAIDGGYIHIIPQANKAKNVFESGKTASYDIKSIAAVQQSGKNSSTFKLIVPRDAERNKRYEFEAESPKMAAEIVQTIKALKQTLDRSGTTKQSRRSRHVS
ncbi:hypothetical protein BDW22DRAFT_1377629 [Trametopsis cervina]|nr:hypothetical protein BDW22DRAFT_1377629 [Trametopsis cervina]